MNSMLLDKSKIIQCYNDYFSNDREMCLNFVKENLPGFQNIDSIGMCNNQSKKELQKYPFAMTVADWIKVDLV